MPGYYKQIIIRTYKAIDEASHHAIRARPWPGQGFPKDANVECSSSMRESAPAGTNFKIKAKITSREGGTPFIYSHYSWRYKILSDDDARIFIEQNN